MHAHGVFPCPWRRMAQSFSAVGYTRPAGAARASACAGRKQPSLGSEATRSPGQWLLVSTADSDAWTTSVSALEQIQPKESRTTETLRHRTDTATVAPSRDFRVVDHGPATN